MRKITIIPQTYAAVEDEDFISVLGQEQSQPRPRRALSSPARAQPSDKMLLNIPFSPQIVRYSLAPTRQCNPAAAVAA